MNQVNNKPTNLDAVDPLVSDPFPDNYTAGTETHPEVMVNLIVFGFVGKRRSLINR